MKSTHVTYGTTSGNILKCPFNGHFTIPRGHRRGFVIGSKVKMMLVGHSMLKDIQITFILHTFIPFRTYFFWRSLSKYSTFSEIRWFQSSVSNGLVYSEAFLSLFLLKVYSLRLDQSLYLVLLAKKTVTTNVLNSTFKITEVQQQQKLTWISTHFNSF